MNEKASLKTPKAVSGWLRASDAAAPLYAAASQPHIFTQGNAAARLSEKFEENGHAPS
jgi:hypothetical protein